MQHADNKGVDAGFDTLDYGYADARGIARNMSAYGERDLWCAVIIQAFVDIGAIAPSNKEAAHRAKAKEFDEAVRWLLRDRKDFVYICDLAGVSPHIIRCAAQIFHGRQMMDDQMIDN